MTGSAIYVWHGENDLYDEVVLDPEPVSRDQAYELALRKLSEDPESTKVHVDFGAKTFVEVKRYVQAA